MITLPMRCISELGVPRGDLDTSSTLIVGAAGRLGRAFAFLWPNARTLTSDQMDIRVRQSVLHTIDALRPRLIINCAAKTDVRACEDDPEDAWAVNVRGVRNLAEAASAVAATMVHFSSDYALRPVNEYAWTKRGSEPFADLTIRAKIYDASHWAWRALKNKEPISMSTLEYSNPITTTGAVGLVTELLSRGARGVAYVGTSERLSFYDIGRRWAKVLGASTECVVPVGEISSPLPRLREMYLSPGSLRSEGIEPPGLSADAIHHLRIYPAYSQGLCKGK